MKKSLRITLTVFFSIIFIGGTVSAGKIGEIKDKIFTDKDHGISLAVPDGYSAKIGSKSKISLRLTLMDKSPVYPRHFLGGNEDYAQVPTLKLLIDTCSSTVDEFIATMLNPEFNSKQKKFFLRHFKIIAKPHDILKSGNISIQKTKVALLEVRQAYEMQISNRGSDRANAINDYLTGWMFFAVRDGKIYMMHFISEYQTSANYTPIWNAVVNSIKFAEAKE
ncbi:MAG: hypothetical protein V3V99_09840 [candidate division Zixibacteria bacterium]